VPLTAATGLYGHHRWALLHVLAPEPPCMHVSVPGVLSLQLQCHISTSAIICLMLCVCMGVCTCSCACMSVSKYVPQGTMLFRDVGRPLLVVVPL